MSSLIAESYSLVLDLASYHRMFATPSVNIRLPY